MFLTSSLIHNGNNFLPEGSVIELNEDGVVVAIHTDLQNDEVETYEGILCPGFINAHCHLELSHLKNKLPKYTGLIPFLQKIPSFRNEFSDEQKSTARKHAYNELIKNGVVAVGDIANVNDTLDVRVLDQLHIHSFIESIGFTETNARQRFEASQSVYQDFLNQTNNSKMLRQSITPHAPYSVSKSLFQLIDQYEKSSLLSIHNQESKAEDEFYQSKKGAVNDLLQGFGIDDSFFIPSGKSSLQTYSEWLSKEHQAIFVHNTFSKKEDIECAMNQFQKTFWCLCPNANLFLENTLPDVNLFLEADAEICIGTDSLASNDELSILAELATLKNNFAHLNWEMLLKWGTINGAKALQMEEKIGSIEVGKQPGIVHLNIENEQAPIANRII